ncbi:MAG: tetratricopeptide repeat protein [Candidatus Scalindua sp.]|nr:tetratricopeptide repeat protein [Candidatus Scalindua sp.]
MENVKERTRKYLRVLDEQKLKIIIGIAVVVAVVLPITLYKQKTNNDFYEVWSRIWRIKSEAVTAKQGEPEKKSETINAFISEYTFLKDNLYTTPATPWLLLELGNTQYKAGKFEDAILTYNEFIVEYNKHPLLSIVRQSLGYAYEEMGQFKDAVNQFEKILNNDEAVFLKAQASLDAGRCYEKLEQLDPASTAYKKVIAVSPESYFAKMAQYRLEDIE